MMSCAVYGCTNSTATTDPTIQYYYFPKHPVIAQQWIAACWRADPIDLNNAQICSIHFDTNSYTSEYKLLDYLGHYTRMLKYDAVPTLYLPNPHTPVIMKPPIEQPVTLSSDGIDQHEIKEIMVYEVQNVSTNQTNFDSSNAVKEYIEIEPHQSLLNVDIKFNTQSVEQLSPESSENSRQEEVNDEKYKHITNSQQLQNLKNDNIALRKQIVQLEETVKKMHTQVAEKNQAVKAKDEDLKRLMQQYDRLHRATMSLIEQRNILSKVFSESQIKILTGKKKIYWSNDDMAMGYTIRHLSNKRCYMYLSKNLNIPLPALSSIKRWSTLKKNEFNKPEKKEETKFEDEDSD
ncbi:hypothetical protein ILUMI_05137 [Ignelater luminosus]|uniref:THAP-type domain-containing protein n=1 Tax=Ignelater luminosus TaxID=2038154 RepID=A0A8K0GIZ0_IGNLU|nr:hypothetical protein ILUMI_05137 [Ignelater luminosus]